MTTFAKPHTTESEMRKPTAIRPAPNRLAPAAFHGPSLLQRKPACACGGGCPRCQATAGLEIGEPDDVYEREADAVADQVMRMAATEAPPSASARQCEGAACAGEGGKTRLQAKPESTFLPALTAGGIPATAPPIVGEVLRSPGQPLDSDTRAFMEPRFGHDFSQVRIHADGQAARSAQVVDARAYTVAGDIVFGAGEHQPQSGTGKRLLAHELAHVVQQGASTAARGRLQREKPDAPAASEWTMGDASFTFWLSHQVASDASFITAGANSTGGWSNPRVFSIAPPERSWMHTSYWADTKEHPIPQGQYQLSVTNDIKFTTSAGQISVDKHFVDKNPVYNGPGKGLTINLGSTTPAKPDLPVFELPLTEAGELEWCAKIGFNDGNVGYCVKGKFSVRPPGLPVAPASGQTPAPTQASAPAPTQPPLQGPAPAAQASASGLPTATLDPSNPYGKPTLSFPTYPPGLLVPPDPSKPLAPYANTGPATPYLQPLPPDKIQRMKDLPGLIKKAGDAVTKDALIRELRDLLSKIPVQPEKDNKKMIDDALHAAVSEGTNQAILALLTALAGKAPSAPLPGAPNVGPAMNPVDLKETVVKSPPIPLGTPPARRPVLWTFNYAGGPHKTYVPGAAMSFTVVPPDNFNSILGNKYVVMLADEKRNSTDENDRLAPRVQIASANKQPVSLTAPQKPGKYVIQVQIGMGYEYNSTFEFEVKPAATGKDTK